MTASSGFSEAPAADTSSATQPFETFRASSRRLPKSVGPRLGTRQPRGLDIAVGQLAGACLLIGLVEVALLLAGTTHAPRWVLLLWPLTAGIYLVAGVVAWLRRPSNRMGALMAFGAMAWLVAGLANAGEVTALQAAGMVAATVPLAVIVHLMLAFPSGALRGRLTAVAVAGAYVTTIVLQVPQYLFGTPSRLQIVDRPGIAGAGLHVQWVLGAAVLLLTCVILHRRPRRARTFRRGVLTPLYAYGLIATLLVGASGEIGKSFQPYHGTGLAAAQVLVLAVVPVIFAVAMFRGPFTGAAGLEQLAEWLGSSPTSRYALATALGDALGDRSVQIAFWLPEANTYVDYDGRPVTLPTGSRDHGVVNVSLDDLHIGAICYDATLIDDHELVSRAGRVIAVALDNERLLAELRASREQLRASRTRIVEAADEERRRIAQDLHDGLQSRLVLLAIQANALRTEGAQGASMHSGGVDLQTGLQMAITELRELVHGVMPELLAERGLHAAVEELTDRLPIPTELIVKDDGPRPPRQVETTCYFVIAEALSNAVKHSQARGLWLVIERQAGVLRVEVRDDGVGGVRAGAGHGMRGMADRIDALDGRLMIDSPPGRGTRVVAEVPCE